MGLALGGEVEGGGCVDEVVDGGEGVVVVVLVVVGGGEAGVFSPVGEGVGVEEVVGGVVKNSLHLGFNASSYSHHVRKVRRVRRRVSFGVGRDLGFLGSLGINSVEKVTFYSSLGRKKVCEREVGFDFFLSLNLDIARFNKPFNHESFLFLEISQTFQVNLNNIPSTLKDDL